MRFAIRWFVVLLMGVAVQARADEAADLDAAQKALDAVPAYRATLVASSSETPGTNRVTNEFVRPDLVHTRAETNGTLDFEAYADGKKTVVSEQGGAYKDAAPGIAAMIARARGQLSLRSEKNDDFTHRVSHLTFSGHETVNGVASSCYKGEDDNEGVGPMTAMHSSVKIWISDQDHRPLRVEWNRRGTQKMDPQDAGKPFSQEVQVTYDYDPSIKISLPTVG